MRLVLGDAFRRVGRHWLSGLILLAVTTLLMTPANYSFAATMADFQTFSPLKPEGGQKSFTPFIVFALTQMVVFSITLVIWLRTILLGPGEVWGNGLSDFLMRAFRLMWRQITAAGWMALLTFPPGFFFLWLGFSKTLVLFYSSLVVLLVVSQFENK